MGMAASQARLLSITARIHDVEYQAQSIQNAKVQLATQSDQAYQDYLEALDSTTLTINTINTNSGETSIITANFNNLCSRNRAISADGNTYALHDKDGNLIVEESIYEGYQDFKESGFENSPYAFALYMMDISNADAQTLRNAENSVYEANQTATDDQTKAMQELHEKLLKLNCSEDNDIYDTSLMPKENEKEYEEALASYQKLLYGKYASEIYVSANQGDATAEDFDKNLYNYYVDIYKQIENSRGCISISDFDGPEGNAAINSDWLQSMIQCGQITVSTIKSNAKAGESLFNPTSPSSDSSLSYTETTSIDKKALAKAEAEYEHTLKQIDKKDQAFDLDLSKLETERTALTTEYESVKKVIEDNIDRTFGIFS